MSSASASRCQSAGSCRSSANAINSAASPLRAGSPLTISCARLTRSPIESPAGRRASTSSARRVSSLSSFVRNSWSGPMTARYTSSDSGGSSTKGSYLNNRNAYDEEPLMRVVLSSQFWPTRRRGICGPPMQNDLGMDRLRGSFRPQIVIYITDALKKRRPTRTVTNTERIGRNLNAADSTERTHGHANPSAPDHRNHANP